MAPGGGEVKPVAKGRTGQSEDMIAGIMDSQLQGRKRNYMDFRRKAGGNGKHFPRLMKGKARNLNHGGVGKNCWRWEGNFCSMRFFFQVNTSIIHLMKAIK